MSYQQITLVGNLGNDPELRKAPSGDPVTSFNLAVSRQWNGQDGERKEKTTWFRISVWGKNAEACQKYLAKGRQVMVVGEEVEARVFTDRDGNARGSLEVKAKEVKFLGQKGDNGGHDEQPQVTKQAPAKTAAPEDLPF